jgi:hypothetical protein
MKQPRLVLYAKQGRQASEDSYAQAGICNIASIRSQTYVDRQAPSDRKEIYVLRQLGMR